MRASEASPVAAITGASGYLGSLVTDGLRSAGFRIRRMVRRPELADDVAYDIVGGAAPGALAGVDVLVHCAYDFALTARGDIWETNVFGTRSLLDAAVAANVRRTIVVSSMSAYTGTRQLYGRAKLAIETDAFARDMCAVRPGLIYGPGWGGMAGTLRKLTSLPIVPLLGRRSHQFTLHEDDARHAIVRLATATTVPSRPLGLCHPEPVPFEDLLTSFATADGGRPPRFLPVPWPPAYWAIRAAERVGLSLPVRADSLLGLVRPAPSAPYPELLEALGITVRSFRR